jgi:hypothetical protein
MPQHREVDPKDLGLSDEDQSLLAQLKNEGDAGGDREDDEEE